MHLRKFDVGRGDIPIGSVSAASDSDALRGPKGRAAAAAAEVDIPEAEREAFELWLRNLWREKDRLMGRFVETGSLGPVAAVVPVRLKHSYEVLDAFCFFVPAVAGWAWSKVRS